MNIVIKKWGYENPLVFKRARFLFSLIHSLITKTKLKGHIYFLFPIINTRVLGMVV